MEQTETIYQAVLHMLNDYYNIGLCMVSVQSGADTDIGHCVNRYCTGKYNENPKASPAEIASLAVTQLQSDLGMAV